MSGVCATYIGIPVIRMPMPNPAINRATKNIAMFTAPAHKAAPMIRMTEPICKDRNLPYLSADQETKAQPKAEPAELRPFIAPIRLEVR